MFPPQAPTLAIRSLFAHERVTFLPPRIRVQAPNRKDQIRMTQVGQDTLATRSTLTVGGKDYSYYSF